MNLEVIDNLNDSIWDKSLACLEDGAELLQSGIWREMIQKEGSTSLRFAWSKEGKIVVLAQVIETTKFAFKFWYLPRGPLALVASLGESEWKRVQADLIVAAKKNGIVSISLEPENWSLKTSLYGQKIKHVQPEKSLFLNLNLSETDLLKAMHAKTRYNIRLADKKGVEIVQGSEDDLKTFWQLLKTTTSRDGFSGHSLVHYQNLLASGRSVIELWLAKKEDKVLAAGIFSFYQGRAVYLHGASGDFGRQYMAPYLLQWQMILRAKEKACRYYDFYGIDALKWPGVTRFKLGFGGEERNYPGTYLIILKTSHYYLYKTLVVIKRFLRKIF
ncbi:MAG: peptidoglycan bridge formation glycyltransferase FemA/FemB family protein [Patescibacteria group bacterium]|nr:peptidoglycan bridge formation glycyltransferase FemA/FemB family protein [Patescibacteria group bacterium]